MSRPLGLRKRRRKLAAFAATGAAARGPSGSGESPATAAGAAKKTPADSLAPVLFPKFVLRPARDHGLRPCYT